MTKNSESQTTARISQNTHSKLIKLKGKLTIEIGRELSNDEVLRVALDLALKDFKNNKDQMTLKL